MPSEILKVARQERNALLKELEANPTFQKYQQMEAVIALYETEEGKPAINPPPAKMVPAYPQARGDTKQAQVERIVLDHMWSTSRRYSSGELLPVLSARGFEITGKVPSKTLASMLSNSNRLNNIKPFGYGPVEWGDMPNATAATKTNEAPPAERQESASQVTGEPDRSPIETQTHEGAGG